MTNDLRNIFETEAMPHLNDLYRTATRLIRSRTAAEDVVQEVYLQAWKSFENYQPGTNCRAWLYKILFFKINHHRRDFYLQTQRIQNLDGDESVLSKAIYHQPIPPHLTDEEIIAAVDKLPAGYRAVVLLADVEEFAYREVAEILNIPIGTVMSRRSRARRQLRKLLTNSANHWQTRQLKDDYLSGAAKI